jgi:glycosyltransferase involved in cell wall biosynthesis
VKSGVLYISYDGILEPLGQSQVLSYLEKLAVDRPIHLISFEKAEDWRDKSRRDAIRDRIDRAGISWHPLRYHKHPSAPATAYDIALGSLRGIAVARKHKLRIVHARSYVAGVMALAVKRAAGAKFLFDMRGFWADERIDGGLWPADGALFRAAKRAERRLLLGADHIVTLTHASERELRQFPYLADRTPPVSVIPTCADLDQFRIQGPPQREPFVLGYVGSVGTWYLLDEMLQCFQEVQAQQPDARLLIVNRREQSFIRERANACGIADRQIEIVAAEHKDMPRLIGRMSAGMALIKPAYSKIASAATKVAEYLGCGIPCLGNQGVGDMVEVLEGRGVGVTLTGFSDEELKVGLAKLLAMTRDPGTPRRCRSAAEALFLLERGASQYATIYDSLMAPFARPDSCPRRRRKPASKAKRLR